MKRADAGGRWLQNVTPLISPRHHLVHLRKQGGERQKGDQSGRCSAGINMNPIESLVSISSYTGLQDYRDRAYTCPTPSIHSAAFSLASTNSHERHAGHLLDSPREEAEVEDVPEEVKVVHRPDFLPQVQLNPSEPIIIRCWSQVLAAIGISFGASIVGGWLSFSSVAIPKMMKGTTADDPIQIDLFLGSWIASLFFIGNIVGCLAGGFVNQVGISHAKLQRCCLLANHFDLKHVVRNILQEVGRQNGVPAVGSTGRPLLGDDCCQPPYLGHPCIQVQKWHLNPG